LFYKALVQAFLRRNDKPIINFKLNIMKKYAVIFTVAVVALLASYSFISEEKFPSDIPEESIAVFESDYLKTIHNADLNKHLETNFPDLFDAVVSVDAQSSPDSGFYFIVFGEKNGEKIIDLLKVEFEDIQNETYTYMNFDTIDRGQSPLYCTTGGLFCPPGCNYNPFAPCLAKCGVWTGLVCITP